MKLSLFPQLLIFHHPKWLKCIQWGTDKSTPGFKGKEPNIYHGRMFETDFGRHKIRIEQYWRTTSVLETRTKGQKAALLRCVYESAMIKSSSNRKGFWDTLSSSGLLCTYLILGILILGSVWYLIDPYFISLKVKHWKPIKSWHRDLPLATLFQGGWHLSKFQEH